MQDCDFIPAQYNERRALQRAVRIRVWCVGILLAMMGLWFISHQHELARVREMALDVSVQHAQVNIHLAKKRSMEAVRARLHDRQWLIEHLDGDTDLVVVFSDISRRIPETVVLTEVSVQCSSLSRYAVAEEQIPGAADYPALQARGAPEGLPQEAPPEVEQVKLTGIAREIPEIIEFAAALEESPLFSRIRRETNKEKTTWAGRVVQEFQLTCDLAAQVGTVQ